MINVFETSFEARERRFQIEKLYHGETVDLVGAVTTDGVLKNITGYTVQGVFQPTTMQGSDQFYELSADIVDNKVIVHWEKGKDFGEPSYMVWALLTDGDDASYPITWRLDMAYSPNFPLSALDPIPKAIDFSKYELLNAPWVELSAVDDLPYIPLSVENSLPYVALSGGTVNSGFSLKSNGNTILGGLNDSPAIGIFSTATGFSTAVGYNAKATTRYSTAVGSVTKTTGENATAVGYGAKALSAKSTAVGGDSTAGGVGSIAVGYGAVTGGQNAVAVGFGSRANADNSMQIGYGTNNVSNSLKVFDKMVLSGDNLTLDPERVPYLSGYAKKEDIPEVPTDLSAFTNSPGYLTAHQSLSDYYTKEEADGKFLTAHQDLTDYATKAFVQSEISDFITEDALTGLATKEEVQAVDDKLSDYAEKEELTAYAQLSDLENIDVGEMSACLSSAEFDEIEELPNDGSASLSSIIAKIDEVIRALKRAQPEPVDPTKTRIVYTDNTTAELDLTGNVTASSIPNISNVKAISFGTNVTSLATSLFSGKTNLVSAEIPGTVAVVPQYCFSDCNNIASVTLHEGVTSIGREAIKPYHLVADEGKSALTSLTLPNSLTSIEFHGLQFCSFSTITLPKNLSNIDQAFVNNPKLAAINVDPENTTFSSEDGVLYQGTTCLTIPPAKTGAVSIKEGTTTLADACASGAKCSSITLPSTLTTIGRYSSLGVSGNDPVGYSSLTIPSAVTSIGEYAFSGLTIPITMEGKTMAQVNSMSNRYWDTKSGASFICTDGTITR